MAIGEAAKYELARRRYVDYVQLVHRGKWKRARHLDIVCDELEKVISGETKRLMIFMPPRHGKSMTVTKTFPSYYLGKLPDNRVIEVSYGDELAKEFGESNREKVMTFGSRLFDIEISDTQATKVNWNLKNHDGGMISVGVGGSITGKGADLLIIDDPIKNRQEAESEAYRKQLMNEYQSSIYTRLHAGGAIIVIVTRWHEYDLVANLLKPESGEPEDWKVISLPCVCDNEETDIMGRKLGEPLWPEHGYDKEWAEQTKRSVGTYAWSSLYQQSPTPAGGAIFKREWMNQRYSKLPEGATIIQSWDLPFTANETSAKCAGLVLARSGANFYFVDCLNQKMEFTENIRAIENMSSKHPLARAKVVENKANGPAIISMLKTKIAGIIDFEPVGSKEDRARSVSPYFEAGNIFFPEEAPWLLDLIEDLISFPTGKYKDTVDATVQGLLYLEKLWGQTGGLIYRRFADNPDAFVLPKTYEQNYQSIHIGIGLGSTRRGTAFVATGITENHKGVHVLKSERYTGDVEPEALGKLFVEFANKIITKYGYVGYAYCGGGKEEYVLYRSIKKAIENAGLSINIRSAANAQENDRIRLTKRLIEQDRLRLIGDECTTMSEALCTSVWSDTKTEDSRLDDGTADVGTLKAFEFTIERESARIIAYEPKKEA